MAPPEEVAVREVEGAEDAAAPLVPRAPPVEVSVLVARAARRLPVILLKRPMPGRRLLEPAPLSQVRIA